MVVHARSTVPAEACAGADVVCLTTGASEPVIRRVGVTVKDAAAAALVLTAARERGLGVEFNL